MDSGRITEHDGEMFCGNCYQKNFGPKGYGFGGGSGTLSMDDGKGYTVSTAQIEIGLNLCYLISKIFFISQYLFILDKQDSC